MKDFLLDLLSPIISAVDWLRQWINGAWAWFLAFLAWLFTPIAWFLDWAKAAFVWLSQQFERMKGFVDSLWERFNDSYSQVSWVLAMANSIFPLNHLLAAVGLLLALWLVALIYRLVKSWIPTVS